MVSSYRWFIIFCSNRWAIRRKWYKWKDSCVITRSIWLCRILGQYHSHICFERRLKSARSDLHSTKQIFTVDYFNNFFEDQCYMNRTRWNTAPKFVLVIKMLHSSFQREIFAFRIEYTVKYQKEFWPQQATAKTLLWYIWDPATLWEYTPGK